MDHFRRNLEWQSTSRLPLSVRVIEHGQLWARECGWTVMRRGTIHFVVPLHWLWIGCRSGYFEIGTTRIHARIFFLLLHLCLYKVN